MTVFQLCEQGLCFLLKFLTGFENNRLLTLFPEVFGMLIGRPNCVCSGPPCATVDFFQGVGLHSGSRGIPLLIWPRVLLCLKSYPSPSSSSSARAASPMAPCCKFLSTFRCWQTHGLFIQNILVSWILNSLRVPGRGSVMSHGYYIFSTRHMEGLHSVFVE